VSHLHFGGGTPTFMPDAELARLIGAFREAFARRAIMERMAADLIDLAKS
jgi:coproporphyrinogen III oxidase-like Fe-S oxidoreductase